MTKNKPSKVDSDQSSLETGITATDPIGAQTELVRSEVLQELNAILRTPEKLEILAETLEVAASLRKLRRIAERHNDEPMYSKAVSAIEDFQKSIPTIDTSHFESAFTVEIDQSRFLNEKTTLEQLEALIEISEQIGPLVIEYANPWLKQLEGGRATIEFGYELCRRLNTLSDAAGKSLFLDKTRIRILPRAKPACASLIFRCLETGSSQKTIAEVTRFPEIYLGDR